MKKIVLILILLVLALFIPGCSKQTAALPSSAAEATGHDGPQVEIVFTFNHKGGIATNQYAVWIESSEGTFIRTIYATHFTANGGWKKRPDALPVWVEKSGLSAGTAQTPDSFSGATPQSGRQSYVWDCKDESGQAVPEGEYHFYVEGTIFWNDAVMFSGTINVRGKDSTVTAEAQYTTEEAKKSDMITGVEAVYTSTR